MRAFRPSFERRRVKVQAQRAVSQTTSTRTALLDAAEHLIDGGELDPSVRAITNEAGLAASSLYEHFESKKAILNAVLARRIEAEIEEDLAAVEQATTIRVALESLVNARIRSVAAHPWFVIYAADLALRSEGDRAIREGRKARVIGLAAGLKRDASKLAKGLSCEEAALLVVVALEGVFTSAVEERPQYLDDPAFAAELVNVLVASIAAAPGPLPRTRARSNASRDWRDRGPGRAPAPRKTARQDRSRAIVRSIIGGAERIIERRGLDEASTPSIADAAGVSIGSLYQYFTDRDSVLGALVDWWIDHDMEKVRSELKELSAVPLSELFAVSHGRLHQQMVRHALVYRAVFRLLPRLKRVAAAQGFLSRAIGEVAANVQQRSGAERLDAELTTFVQGWAWVAWIRTFITHDLAFFCGEAFATTLDRLGRAVVVRDEVET